MKIAVLLSGGVDSSVALRLLKDQGHHLTAFYLKIWLQDEFSFLGNCPWDEDIQFAQEVCAQAEVPFKTITMQTEYWEHVVTYTISEIKAGRTPNPDIFCNSLIKFGKFIDKIDPSFEKVASGHYARTEIVGGSALLKTSPDPIKDQTYFLAYLNQTQLSRAIFPIGEFTKKEIRRLAEKYSLPNMARKDSQGICFLGKIKFRDFIKHHLGDSPGDIIDINSEKKLGSHNGYYYYTIGQRSGLGLSGGPWYVVRKDTENNTIYISGTEELIKKERDTFVVENMNWISPDWSSAIRQEGLRVKIRHGARTSGAQVTEENNGIYTVRIDSREKGIAPGQFAVFYLDNTCLGGGIISEKTF